MPLPTLRWPFRINQSRAWFSLRSLLRRYYLSMSVRKSVTERLRVWILVSLFLIIPKVLYVTALGIVPFLPFATGVKVAIATGLIVAAEVVFFALAFFVGKEVISRYRGYLDPRRWLVKR